MSREILYSGYRFQVVRLRQSDGGSTIVKTLSGGMLAERARRELENEFHILQRLTGVDGVVQLIRYDADKPQLLLRDSAGASLHSFPTGYFADIDRFFTVAVALAGIVAQVHERGVTHCDINPRNIIYCDRDIPYVEMIDFGLSVSYRQTNEGFLPLNSIVGTLSYISPEQTGRTNRPIDYRTDFYSLGATFYELLTGRPPYTTSDPLEMVHAHLARIPEAPHLVKREIPAPLSAIILKLLAKNAEERYQSARGLQEDLIRCRAEWQAGGPVADFVLGCRDQPIVFTPPTRLYGRDDECVQLLNNFRQITEGTSRALMVTGDSGVGKSRLVSELYQPIIEAGGTFIQGKFEQHKRHLPYYAIVQALDQLVELWLSESVEQLAARRDALLQLVPESAALLVDLVPKLGQVLGALPTVTDVAPNEVQQRLQYNLLRFIGSACSAERPLVCFIDDLQWADPASLALIGSVLTDESIQGLLFIGSYRSNEVDAAHPLVRTLNHVISQHYPVETVYLSSLAIDHVKELLHDMYGNGSGDTDALASAIYSKTQGNIFYILALLQRIQRNQLLKYSAEEQRWVWELDRITALSSSDNVVNFLLDEFQQLAPKTQYGAAVAACLGGVVVMSKLRRVLDVEMKALREILLPLIEREVLLPTTRSTSSLFDGDTRLRFCHDRMQQAAYSLLESEERIALHHRIATLIYAAIDDEEVVTDEAYYSAVEHYEKAIDELVNREERLRVARLAVEAGRRARRAAAFDVALQCFHFARRLLPDDNPWVTHPELTFAIESERHAVLFILSNYKECDQLFSQLIEHAPSPISLTDSIGVQAISLSNRGRYEDAVRLGLRQLRALSFDLPGEEEWDQALGEELGRLYEVISTEGIERLAELPLCSNPVAIACFHTINKLIPASFFWDGRRALWMILRGARMCYEHGYTEGASYVLVCLMLPMAAMKTDFRTAHQIAEQAMMLVDRHRNTNDKARTFHVYGLFQCHWFHPVEEGLRYGHEAHERNLRIGDMELACFAYFTSLAARLEIGPTLTELSQEAAAAMRFAAKTDNAHASASYVIFQRLIAALSGESGLSGSSIPGSFDSPESPDVADGEKAFSESVHCQQIAGNAMAQCYYLIYRALSACIFGDFSRALHLCTQAAPLTMAIMGFYPLALHNVLYSIALCRSLTPEFDDEIDDEKRASYLATLDNNLDWFEARTKDCPSNFAHLHHLIVAERYNALDDFAAAATFYELAVNESSGCGRPYHYALACELAGLAYASRGLQRPANGYTRDAHDAYAAWGASAKAAELRARHGWLARATPQNMSNMRQLATESLGASTTMVNLDSMAIVRAFQSLSSERTVGRLLVVMQDLIMHHSGADRGLLFVYHQDRWQLAVSADTRADCTALHLGENEAHAAVDYSERVFHYCVNSQEPLVISDVRTDPAYLNDSYFRDSGARAVLGLPIVHAGRLEALLLLENRVTTGAFTMERVSILALIGGQFAIAMRNVLIYQHLEETVAARTAELNELNQTLERRVAQRTQELELSERFNRMLFDESPVGLALCDSEGAVLDANSAYGELVGREVPAIKGTKLSDILDENERAAQGRRWQQLLEDRRYGPVEQIYSRADGTSIPVQVNSVLVSKDDKLMQWLAVADISLRKQAEQEHIEARRAAEQANRAKSQFLANMSHELRTPLNAIIGFADLLAEDAQAAGQKDAVNDLEYIRRAAKHLLSLITDVLDLSRIESGKEVPVIETVDVSDLIDEIIATIKLRMHENNNHLAVTCDRAIGLVRLDPRRTRQVVLNLLDNASKFTDDGEIVLSARLLQDSRSDSYRMEFRVSDSGDGIAPEDHERIFQAFEQVDSSSTREHDGSGLGLALCQRLCHLMGGHITLESEPGQGATFIVELPVERVLVANEGVESVVASVSSRPKASEPKTLTRACPLVLVIDQSDDMRDIIGRTLASAGYEIMEASRGMDGLHLARTYEPNAIVLDTDLPDISGWALIAELRFAMNLPNTEIFPTTNADDMHRCAALGVKTCLPKPLMREQLLTLLADTLGQGA